MKCRILPKVTICLLLAGIGSVSAEVTIDFDNVPDGTVIETEYEAVGVTFDCASGVFCTAGDEVVARVPGDSNPSSSPNVVSVPSDGDACFNDNNAIVQAIFDPIASNVSINGISNDGFEDAFLNAYDESGVFLDSDLVTFTHTNQVLLLSVSGAISYVEFAGIDDGVCFDDLSFVPAVPTLDAIFANGGFGAERNRVCLGGGIGGFICSDVSTSEASSWGVALGHVDSDHKLDAVIANSPPATNRVCLGDGEGEFTCSAVSTDTNDSRDLALGHVDGNATLDVVFANSGQRNRVCFGDGLGGFTCDYVSEDQSETYGVVLGYLDSDWNLDAVFATWGGPRNRVCLGDGTGGFTCSDISTIGDWSQGVALGLVNGDQALDAVFASGQVCFGIGNGDFTCSTLLFSEGGPSVALGHVDSDQALDVVFARADLPNRVCLGDGLGGFTCSDVSTDAFRSETVALGHIDGDQNLDAVFGNANGQRNRVCLGDGSAGFTCSDVGEDENWSYGVALGFIDDADLIFSDGFESGDTSAWSHSVPQSARLRDVTRAAPPRSAFP